MSFPSAVQHSGWRLSITTVDKLLAEILWKDIHHPLYAQMEITVTYYSALLQFIRLLPDQVQHVTIEADPPLIISILDPSSSAWKVRFQTRNIHSLIIKVAHVQTSRLHQHTIRSSKFLCRNFGNPTHLNSCELQNLYSTFAQGVGGC